MSPASRAIRAEIEELGIHLLEAGLLLASRPVVINRYSGTELVSWPPPALDEPVIDYQSFATVADYRRQLRLGYYSFVLFDGSMLQITYATRKGQVTKHRLCYHPCPVVFDQGELEEAQDLLEYFDGKLADELFKQLDDRSRHLLDGEPQSDTPQKSTSSRLLLRSPIRFDYDLHSEKAGHSAGHLHITHEDCRIPVFGPLSIGHFTRFVFRHLYAAEFEKHEFLRQWPLRFGVRTVAPEECTELFFECRQATPKGAGEVVNPKGRRRRSRR